MENVRQSNQQSPTLKESFLRRQAAHCLRQFDRDPSNTETIKKASKIVGEVLPLLALEFSESQKFYQGDKNLRDQLKELCDNFKEAGLESSPDSLEKLRLTSEALAFKCSRQSMVRSLFGETGLTDPIDKLKCFTEFPSPIDDNLKAWLGDFGAQIELFQDKIDVVETEEEKKQLDEEFRFLIDDFEDLAKKDSRLSEKALTKHIEGLRLAEKHIKQNYSGSNVLEMGLGMSKFTQNRRLLAAFESLSNVISGKEEVGLEKISRTIPALIFILSPVEEQSSIKEQSSEDECVIC